MASPFSNIQATVQSTFASLTARERRIVSAGAIGVVLIVVVLVSSSFNSSAANIRKKTAQKIAALDEIRALTSNYREAKAAQEAAERQLSQSKIGILSYVEEHAKQKGLELPRIDPKPEMPLEGTKIVENSVELTLTDVKLNRLVEFIQAVENGPAVVRVKYMRLEPRPANETISAWLTISTYRLKN